MNHSFAQLIRLLEITRSMPQTGYALSEMRKEELSDLAQHHYLVTAIAWQLARAALRAGGKLDLSRVLEYALVHDLGEVFGGDISLPYAKANPVAREAAKEFEARNQEYFSTWFGEDEKYIRGLFREVMEATTDEALVTKIADYIEVTHYKLYVRRLTKKDIEMAREIIGEKMSKLGDVRTRETLASLTDEWLDQLDTESPELFDAYKASGS